MEATSCVLAKYGEITLKGRNRSRFERTLLTNLRESLSDLEVRIRRRGGFLVVSSHDCAGEELARRLRDVMGFSVVQPMLRVPCSPEAAASAAVELLRARGGEHSFAVRVRRRGTAVAMSSDELAAYIGARVCGELGRTVDLRTPDTTVFVEVDPREIFVGLHRHPGQGGLPVGATGAALVLLSGGYDSPVAAYRAMRRGLRCDFVHFTGAPFTDAASAYKAYALAYELTRFQPHARLHLVPVGHAQKALAIAGAGPLQTMAHRRLYLRLAERLATADQRVLLTGDSLGQVASQTLDNLLTADHACALPVLRPLIGWDKQEILDEARRIGTFDISTLPDQDCCRLFTPPSVATRSTPAQFDPIDTRADIETLIDDALTRTRTLAVQRAAAPPRHRAAG
ncbi:tRNA uracil 4-sulfurtransferase ThiI [Nocardia veterana]|uniref:Probable tRNA sulfurtransferase n=1 Tax=Nocardia veterana TaxID=132249 RepID=A0A7X6M2F7_9NOCA|nr:tRNA uracil 4-sulfurtransferase ThiI [Nocardia veterana]NKY88150.1 tRNA 4-thiouridine(8) synthase ThiI [Nocardia veterana]